MSACEIFVLVIKILKKFVANPCFVSLLLCYNTSQTLYCDIANINDNTK